MKKAIFAAGALLLPLVAFAEWSQPVTITHYFIHEDAGAYIRTSNNVNATPTCGDSQYLAFDTSKPNFKAMWAQILTAYASGQSVALNYDGCLGGHQKIIAIAVPSIW